MGLKFLFGGRIVCNHTLVREARRYFFYSLDTYLSKIATQKHIDSIYIKLLYNILCVLSIDFTNLLVILQLFE